MPKAVVCRLLGGPEALALEAVESRPLAPGEVRVAIHASEVNFPHLLMPEGRFQHKPPLPFVPGLEAAGIVMVALVSQMLPLARFADALRLLRDRKVSSC